MCDAKFTGLMAGGFTAIGLFVAGVVLLGQAGQSLKATNFSYLPAFESYEPARCTVVEFKAVLETKTSSKYVCFDADCYDAVDRFLGVAGVRVAGDARLYAAVVQLEPGQKAPPSTEVGDEAVNKTFDAARIALGDVVDCGVAPGGAEPPLFSAVDEVPVENMVALNFNSETAAAAWAPTLRGYVVGGSLLGASAVCGAFVGMLVACMCCCKGCDCESDSSTAARRRRERDFVDGTLSRNTCDYGCLNWLGWCCFTTFGGTFEPAAAEPIE